MFGTHATADLLGSLACMRQLRLDGETERAAHVQHLCVLACAAHQHACWLSPNVCTAQLCFGNATELLPPAAGLCSSSSPSCCWRAGSSSWQRSGGGRRGRAVLGSAVLAVEPCTAAGLPVNTNAAAQLLLRCCCGGGYPSAHPWQHVCRSTSCIAGGPPALSGGGRQRWPSWRREGAQLTRNHHFVAIQEALSTAAAAVLVSSGLWPSSLR